MATPNSDREPPFLLSLLMQPLVWGSLLVLLGSSVMAWAYWRNPGDLQFSQGDNGGGAGNTWRPDAVDVEEIAAGIDSSNILAQQMRAAELIDGEAMGLERPDQDKKAPEADSAAEILKRLSGPVAGPIGERTASGGGIDDVVPERIQFGEGESVSSGNSLGGFRADGQFVPSASGVAPAGDPLRAAMDRFNAVQSQQGAGRPAIAPGVPTGSGQAYNTTVPISGGGSSYGMTGAGAYNNTVTPGAVPMVGVPDGRLPASSSLVPPPTGVPVGGGFTNRGARDGSGSNFAPPAPAPVTQDTRSATDSGAPLPQDVPTPNNIGGRSFNSFSNPYDTQR
ncbi:MAG: hypothetical protein Fur0042_08220 [Cyanophyceae cyanobacterium]